MDETDLSELRDEVKRLALDLLSNETLVVKQTTQNSTQGRERGSTLNSELNGEKTNTRDSTQGTEKSNEMEILFYGRAEIGGDTITLLNNASPVIADLCRCLLSASAANRQASWNFILKALS